MADQALTGNAVSPSPECQRCGRLQRPSAAVTVTEHDSIGDKQWGVNMLGGLSGGGVQEVCPKPFEASNSCVVRLGLRWQVCERTAGDS